LDGQPGVIPQRLETTRERRQEPDRKVTKEIRRANGADHTAHRRSRRTVCAPRCGTPQTLVVP
jgi:hypothetical protein